MKHLFLSLLFVIATGFLGRLSAQTFYEITYTDTQGYENYGLMLYYDEEDCMLNLLCQTSEDDEYIHRSLSYISVNSDDDEEIPHLIMACEDDETPIFIWIWDKDESEEDQLIPYIAMDEDDDVDDWIRATSCLEVDLRELTPDYLAQFLDTESKIYKQVCRAHRDALAADEEADEQIITTAFNNEGNEQTVNANTANSNSVNNTNNANKNTAATTISLSDRPVMHLFVVANTEVADIGSSCRTDYSNIANEMRGIAQSLNISLKEYNVIGSNYSKANLKQQLAALKPASNDIVLFLYTGHGFRFDNQNDSYPMMLLTTNDYQELDDNYVAVSDVYDAISKKGARLNIVLSDCCNSYIGERRPLQSNTLFTRGNNNFSRQRLAELFFNAKGSIMSTAASPGEVSWCDTAGGMFTLSFIQALRKEIGAMNTGTVTWDSVVNNTLKAALQRSSNNAQAQNGQKSVKIVNL